MKQAELFTDATQKGTAEVCIPDFKLLNNYVSEEEERELLARIDREQWQTDFRRRTQQYGLGYSAEHGQKPVWLRDFPDWLMPLATRVGVDAEFERFPENCVVNEYIPPLGIGPHRDYPAFGPTIACVSLGSDIVMDFTEPEDKLRAAIHVPARSFWVITGTARYKWRHGIASRLTDLIAGERRPRGRRVSITFRTAR